MRTQQNRQAADASGSQSSEEDVVRLPSGFGFAGDTTEEETEQLQDLEAEGPETGAGEEGEEEEPQALTPAEIAVLRKRAKEADELEKVIGRQGTELGELRRKVQAAPPAPTGPAGPQVDPYQQDIEQAFEQFLQTGDHKAYAARLSRNMNARIAVAGDYFRNEIVTATKAETDFFAKNSDLMDGTPRSIYEGELAKARLLNPRGNASEQRVQAAEQTRTVLREMGGRLTDEDAAAKAEAERLKGPAGRRSRTGAPNAPGGGMASVAQATQEYIAMHQKNQQRTRTRS